MIERVILVFGSNEAGRHGTGAANHARHYYGVYGQGVGLAGGSYALPTKDGRMNTLPLPRIKSYADQFLAFAKERPNWTFLLTRVGCGFAGYKDTDIAPMFADATPNVRLPDAFREVLTP